jgi:hypothetical protein
MPGYLGDSSKNAKTFAGGWYHTQGSVMFDV